MYFVPLCNTIFFLLREPAHSHTDKFKNLGTLKSYQSMQYHAITLVLPFVWVPQFEIKKAKYCFYFNEATSTWNLRTIPTFSFHYPLSIRTGGVVCEQRLSIQSEFRPRFFIEILYPDSENKSWTRFSGSCTPDADENSELLVLFLVLLRITTVLNLFLFFGPFERLWYRMNDVNKSKKNLKFMFGLCFKSSQ